MVLQGRQGKLTRVEHGIRYLVLASSNKLVPAFENMDSC